eukprot:jgi/Mesvir1/14366/Mv09768-RA.1
MDAGPSCPQVFHFVVTDSLAPLFDTVVATEASPPLARRLRARGYRCVVTSTDLEMACREAEACLRPSPGRSWLPWGRGKDATSSSSRKMPAFLPSSAQLTATVTENRSFGRGPAAGSSRGSSSGGRPPDDAGMGEDSQGGGGGGRCHLSEAAERPPLLFDVVACLNVLDRCDAPLTLLRQCRERLHPAHGRLLLAVVLPFKPFVEIGTERRAPTEVLPVPCCGTWESAVEALVEKVLLPCGFAVQRIARAPYLSRGHVGAPVLSLDDAVFVLSCQTQGKDDS